MYLTMCILHSNWPNINLILLIILRKQLVHLFHSKYIEEQISSASEVCFSSLKLEFPVISGLKKNQSKYQEQLLIVNTVKTRV